MILSFDTSNYTTSVALIGEDGTIQGDFRRMLEVKKGERGLRQSDAFFQHGKNIPVLLETLVSETGSLKNAITCVAVSTRPRSKEGSYMPCFLAGAETAREIAALFNVPLFEFSHQEGHMAAASYGTILENESSYLAWHLSGGTCELLKWNREGGEEIIGGTKDISFGQVIDRTGVLLGLPFPAGKYLDRICLSNSDSSLRFPKIKPDGLFFNLSGLETHITREIKKGESAETLSAPLFRSMADTIEICTKRASERTGIRSVLFAGGVSSSAFLRMLLEDRLDSMNFAFGEPAYASDNAVGIGLLACKALKNHRKGGAF